MKKTIKEYLYKRYLPIISFSQEGEDKILERIFHDVEKGFFIDIGAHHPIRFSNTYKFYLKGWTGINIDAMPGSMKVFDELRPNDRNLEIAISNENKSLTYFMFDEPALNGFSDKLSLDRDRDTKYTIIEKREIKTKKLTSVLDSYLSAELNEISFMSIDVEGLDLNVLESNDWTKYRPKIVLVELLDYLEMGSDPIFLFMKSKGYKFFAKTYYTCFFINEE
jgi:FkbM family methyltransferase